MKVEEKFLIAESHIHCIYWYRQADWAMANSIHRQCLCRTPPGPNHQLTQLAPHIHDARNSTRNGCMENKRNLWSVEMQNRARSYQKLAPGFMQIPSGFPCLFDAFCLLSVRSPVPAAIFLTAILFTIPPKIITVTKRN